jgi:hypothetical protein
MRSHDVRSGPFDSSDCPDPSGLSPTALF